ncbi:MAG: MBL fold metallo-hydrolase [Nocardiopsaceae bacterium]|nr:MBL fold metallo-hydrolase [Nocardiopsaceae bacterium]
MEIVAIDTPSLGDRSYLIHDGTVAVVIDPQRDIDRVLDLAAQAGVTITHVFETHLHNDYVTGGLALAEVTGAAYHVNAADEVAFDRVPVSDGDIVEVSPSLRVRVLATPGHTFTHLSYVLLADGQTPAVFTGGSLLYGSTGRPDLLGSAHAGSLARAQYASAHRLIDMLPEDSGVYPTHGFGSFCSSTQSEGTASTLGRERRTNPVLTLGEQDYIASMFAGLDAYPAYYAHMGSANATGPAPVDLSPPHRADAAELSARIGAGEWVADLRSRTAFAAGHVGGTLSFPLDSSFATYLGWLIRWGSPLTLLGDTPEQVADAQRELARIGIDRPAAAATGRPEEWAGEQPLRSYPVASFAELDAVRHHRPVTVLDVRRNLEWAESHLEGAVHIPLHELQDRLSDLPPGEIWVHCQAGYRAGVAASILDAAGRVVVAIDDDYDHAAGAALRLITSNTNR